MAAIDLVILSSSPAKSYKNNSALSRTISSSPSGPPSRNVLIQHRQLVLPRISDPSHKALSTSAGGLLGSNDITQARQGDSIWDFPDEDTMEKQAVNPNTSNLKTAQWTRAKSIVTMDNEDTNKAPLKKPRKSRVKNTIDEAADLLVARGTAKEKALRSPRAKKSAIEGQTKIPKGKVTKSSSDTICRSEGKADGSVSAYFAKFTDVGDYIDIDSITQDTSMNMAAKRRTDWTPPKITGSDHLFGSAFGGVVDLDTPPKGLTDLFGSFGYSESTATTTWEPEMLPARKRKLIELVKTNVTAGAPQFVPKTKVARKRPTTITERATAAYVQDNEDDTMPTSLVQYPSHQDSVEGVSAKPRAKGPAKKSKKIKKAAPPPPVLLAPQAALQQANRQEFVFGTSSQIVQDDDPEFLRDLQQAVRLSNQSEDTFSEDLYPSSNFTSSRNSKSTRQKPSLWEEALKIEHEGATEIELLDLISSSPADDDLPVNQPALTSQPQSIDTSDESLQQYNGTVLPPTTSVSASKELPLQHENATTSKPGKSAELSTSGFCPDFASYSTAELAKELASYKFKPIKNREQVISLLEKCWEGKQRAALGSLGVNTLINKATQKSTLPQRMQSPPLMPAASTERSLDKLRKDSDSTMSSAITMSKPTAEQSLTSRNPKQLASCTKATSTFRQSPKRAMKVIAPIIEEISNSENSTTPSPLRNASRNRSQPALSLATDDDDTTLIPLSPNSAEKELFEHITKAITTAPRGTHQEPSWYEKMLMYDPIVLEDLALWLNTEGLNAVGYDGEAKGVQVKAWCRARSVCCLWKISSRKGGGVKKVGRES